MICRRRWIRESGSLPVTSEPLSRRQVADLFDIEANPERLALAGPELGATGSIVFFWLKRLRSSVGPTERSRSLGKGSRYSFE